VSEMLSKSAQNTSLIIIEYPLYISWNHCRQDAI